MPVSVKSLTSGERKTTVTWLGEEIEFTYNPGAINAKTEDEFENANNLGKTGSALVTMMNKILKDFVNVTKEDGSKQSPTHDFLMEIPTPLLWRFYHACMDDMRGAPLAGNGASSNGTSPTTATSEKSQTGTD